MDVLQQKNKKLEIKGEKRVWKGFSLFFWNTSGTCATQKKPK
jgi:hypothetical protein